MIYFWLKIQGFGGSNSKINFHKSGFCSETKAMASAAKIMQDPESISYLNQQEAAEVDEILMGPLGFSVDQLMVCFFFFLFFNLAVVFRFIFSGFSGMKGEFFCCRN